MFPYILRGVVQFTNIYYYFFLSKTFIGAFATNVRQSVVVQKYYFGHSLYYLYANLCDISVIRMTEEHFVCKFGSNVASPDGIIKQTI